jgi:sugar phosphate isomerase/epimerase
VTATERGDLSTRWRRRLGGIGDEAALAVEDQILVHQELGWPHLELRTVDGVALGDLPVREVERIAGLLADAGLRVPCLDSRIGNWARPITYPFERELAELDAMIAAARLLGARYVRVMSFPNDGLSESAWAAETVRRFGILVRRAQEHDIVLLHENCSGWAGESAKRAVRLVEEVDSPSLRVLFDVGNPVAHGYDGAEYLAEIVGWVRHTHLKDALPPRDGHDAVFTAPGEGVAGLTDRLATLLAAGYRGVFCVEPHLAVLPHAGRRADPAVVRSAYLDYGRRLEAVLAALDVAP